jgi:hypothetical protein
MERNTFASCDLPQFDRVAYWLRRSRAGAARSSVSGLRRPCDPREILGVRLPVARLKGVLQGRPWAADNRRRRGGKAARTISPTLPASSKPFRAFGECVSAAIRDRLVSRTGMKSRQDAPEAFRSVRSRNSRMRRGYSTGARTPRLRTPGAGHNPQRHARGIYGRESRRRAARACACRCFVNHEYGTRTSPTATPGDPWPTATP